MDSKHIQFGNEGEALVPGKTENLSSAWHEASRAAEIDAHLGDKPDDEETPGQFDRRETELAADKRARQDREQGGIEREGGRDAGAVGG